MAIYEAWRRERSTLPPECLGKRIPLLDRRTRGFGGLLNTLEGSKQNFRGFFMVKKYSLMAIFALAMGWTASVGAANFTYLIVTGKDLSTDSAKGTPVLATAGLHTNSNGLSSYSKTQVKGGKHFAVTVSTDRAAFWDYCRDTKGVIPEIRLDIYSATLDGQEKLSGSYVFTNLRVSDISEEGTDSKVQFSYERMAHTRFNGDGTVRPVASKNE
jgi:hypothetical protein